MLVGVGIGTPAQAVEVCEVADGVVVGSAVVRRALETGSPEAVADLVASFRTALDARLSRRAVAARIGEESHGARESLDFKANARMDGIAC